VGKKTLGQGRTHGGWRKSKKFPSRDTGGKKFFAATGRRKNAETEDQ